MEYSDYCFELEKIILHLKKFMFLYLKSLGSTKHLLNLTIYGTEEEKNIWLNYSYNVEMHEYAKIY